MALGRHRRAEEQNNSFHHLFASGEAEVAQGFEGSLHKSILVLAEIQFLFLLPRIPSWAVHEALNSAAT